MRPYQHVLAATDFSEHSERIVARAVDVAEHYQARVSVIHVSAYLPSFELGGELVLPPGAEIEQALLKQARTRLVELAEKFKIEPLNTHAMMGTPRTDILRFAREQNVDLIVVGRHSRHGLGLLIGSTASGVLNGSPCDVFAVTV